MEIEQTARNAMKNLRFVPQVSGRVALRSLQGWIPLRSTEAK
jgi:hypothetical protein